MAERPRKRHRAQEGQSSAERAEEAEARGVRDRVEQALGQEREDDEAPRVSSHASWRLATMAAVPLGILILAGINQTRDCLDEREQEGQRELHRELAKQKKENVEANVPLQTVLLELARTKNSPLEPEAFYAKLASIQEGVLDPVTGDILCGANAKNLSDEPLIEVEVGKKRFRIRKTLAEAAQKATAQMKADGKGGIDIDSGLRYNYEQYLIWLDALAPTENNPLNTGWAAAPPCLSRHERGDAIDVDNWPEAEEYLWAQGVPGGLHGIFKDPRHFSLGEFQRGGKAAATRQWVWWKTHGMKIKWNRWKSKKGGRKK